MPGGADQEIPGCALTGGSSSDLCGSKQGSEAISLTRSRGFDASTEFPQAIGAIRGDEEFSTMRRVSQRERVGSARATLNTQSAGPPRKRLPFQILLCAMLVAMLLPTTEAGSDKTQLKAEFVSRIVRFVDWPEGTFASDSDPIRIGILGEASSLNDLAAALAKSTAGSRRFEVKRLADSAEAESVHIVILGNSRARALRRIASELKGKAVLSIAPSFTFAEDGGILGMEVYRGKIAFEVNNRSAREADLRISSRVLRLASTVY
jgi:hypothetical protein